MSLSLLFTGFSFWIPESSSAHIGCIALGIYLFGIVYSPGEGPVPFTYSAEAYPLYIRPIGMSLATAITWFFNFVLAVTWPSLLQAFKPQGAFGWYAAWNLVGWVFVLLLVPETKERTLEELDRVFDVSLGRQVRFGLAQAKWFVGRWILGRKGVRKPVAPVEGDGEYEGVIPSGDGEKEKGEVGSFQHSEGREKTVRDGVREREDPSNKA